MDINKLWTPIVLISLIISCDNASIDLEECDVPQEICRIEAVNYTEIPNLSFEEWNETSNGYSQPWPGSFWATPNEAIEFFDGGAVVERAGDDYALEGEGFSAKLITRLNLPPLSNSADVTAGSIVSGKFATDLSDPERSIRFGRPFNRRISSVHGYYMYLPQGSDVCGMYAVMRTCSIIEDACENRYGIIDTIAMDVFRSSESVDEFTEFELELEYDSELYPDEVILFFTSSDAAGDGVAGSTLYLDQLSVEFE